MEKGYTKAFLPALANTQDSALVTIEQRVCKYMHCGLNSNNEVVSYMFNRAALEFKGLIGQNMKYLYNKINMELKKDVLGHSHYILCMTYCDSYYGSQAWLLSNVDMFDTAWRKVIRRLFSLPWQTHRIVHLLPLNKGYASICIVV